MVGVQKSCVTCRRGRIKCDQSRPTCRTCASRSKVCEGYERHGIFVNQTVQALHARRTPDNQTPERVSQDTTDWSQLSSEVVFKALAWSPGLNRSLLSPFFQVFEPRSPHDRNGPLIIWLRQACMLGITTQLLALSLHALAAGRLAALVDDQDLARESRILYGKALRLFAKELESDQVPTDDQVLAAGRCLLIYELYEPTTQSIMGPISHNRGLNQIVLLRGVESFKTPFARALLLDIRYANLAHSVQFCSSLPFADKQWRLPGSPRSLHDAEHSYIDLGGDITPFLRHRRSPVPEDQAPIDSTPDEALLMLIDHDQRFNDLLARIKRLAPEGSSRLDTDGQIWDLESAIIVGNIRCLKLCISYSIRHYASNLCSSSLDSAAHAAISECVPQYTDAHEEAMARRALDALMHTTAPEAGLYGGQRALLGLRLLVAVLPTESSLYKAASEMNQGLTKERHLQHATDLSRIWGDVK